MKKTINTLLAALFFCTSIFSQVGISTVEISSLDSYLATTEAKVIGIKPNNAAKIIWADGYKNKKTAVAFVYLHGFGASHREGEPVLKKLSTKYKANIYLSRLEEHGLYRKNTFEFLTPENYIASAQQALEIGKKLGEKVILVSTSTGGTLSLKLASEDPSISGLILYSPFVDLFNPAMAGIILPGGREKFKETIGGNMRTQNRPEEQAKYWSTNYHINGYVSLITMLKQNMTETTFTKVKCPVFLGYYYKNEKEQDQVVSVSAMHTMYNSLGTPENKKTKIAFPESGDHVIACDLRSKDWQGVYRATVRFLNQTILQ
ncbi:carboxylesterase [Flavobacterium sp. GSP6]|uniref:alpha/beta hydrolase n=1 Tax=Flavobacterium sp. GSP6 TaxID=2497488 RepID=UPI000F870F54|nr:alpha/beta hydrolase [Flavobacterium sp. GSP6]RTZ06803.1 alpha/beta hydrolase [Flavobacterium sp. GSP6]